MWSMPILHGLLSHVNTLRFLLEVSQLFLQHFFTVSDTCFGLIVCVASFVPLVTVSVLQLLNVCRSARIVIKLQCRRAKQTNKQNNARQAKRKKNIQCLLSDTGWQFLPEKNRNNVPGHLRRDASTTGRVHHCLIQYMLINIFTGMFPQLPPSYGT